MATYTRDVELVAYSIPEVTPTWIQAPIQPEAVIALNVEEIPFGVAPFALVGLAPTLVLQPLQPEAVIVLDVEVIPFGVAPFAFIGVIPTYIPAPLQDPIIYTRDVEVISIGGETIIIEPEDIVAQFVAAMVPTTRTTMHTTPANKQDVLRYLELVNTDASDRTVDIWFKGRKWVHAKVIVAGGEYAKNGIWYLTEGEIVEALASGTNVEMFLSGVRENV